MSKNLQIIYCTIDSMEAAEQLADAALNLKLAACVNVFPIQSYYYWNKKKEKTMEFVMIFKTLKKKKKTLVRLIEKEHSYEVPCILSFEAGVNTTFEAWTKSNLVT
ncbi:MAG: divalent-cation tolerance protein CutA [Bacteroidota bacterium]|nr:divalent-cation tolerance protein CutA [Bacteroidota bacterium]